MKTHHATWNDGDDDRWSCGLARCSTMAIFVVTKTGGSCFRCFFATLFALFTLVDADLPLTPENVCCSFFQIRTVVVKTVYICGHCHTTLNR